MDRTDLKSDNPSPSAGDDDGEDTVAPQNLTRYEQYRQLRVECGYDAIPSLNEDVWNGFDAIAQEEMLRQLRRLRRY